MNKEQLREAIEDFQKSETKSSSYLTDIRNEIFSSYERGEIMDSQKTKLLKKLYEVASEKKMFFVSIMDRKPENLPKQEEEDTDEWEESYEESYEDSYDEDEDQD